MRSWSWLIVLLLFGFYGLLPIKPVWQMVLISISIFLLLKCQALRSSDAFNRNARSIDKLVWFFAWPGLDTEAFFVTRKVEPTPELGSWVIAILKTIFGIVLVFRFAPNLVEWNKLIAGWVAMIGIVFFLHFGLFHLVALVWRSVGRDVTPIMNKPILASSLAEFWNRRWNIAFRDFTYAHVFRPLAKQHNTTIAIWGGFLFSGVIHELAISIPAQGGYGLPMGYFLLQGFGFAVERKAHRRTWWKKSSFCGWLFVVLLTVPAAYFLFHPPFIHRVILPLIQIDF